MPYMLLGARAYLPQSPVTWWLQRLAGKIAINARRAMFYPGSILVVKTEVRDKAGEEAGLLRSLQRAPRWDIEPTMRRVTRLAALWCDGNGNGLVRSRVYVHYCNPRHVGCTGESEPVEGVWWRRRWMRPRVLPLMRRNAYNHQTARRLYESVM